jgi:3-hydroxyisobutyrate dehydrogenase-like beta-hydroxyacid dehydrogenase
LGPGANGGETMTIHWCGTGLSSIPGLRRLIEAGHPVTVWNRTVEKARAEVGDLTQDIRAFSAWRLWRRR